MKHCLILTPHCRANRQLVLRPLQILLGCLERLEERDSSEVSFFMIFFMILHSYSRIGIIPVLNLSMIDAPCLTGGCQWFLVTASVDTLGIYGTG